MVAINNHSGDRRHWRYLQGYLDGKVNCFNVVLLYKISYGRVFFLWLYAMPIKVRTKKIIQKDWGK